MTTRLAEISRKTKETDISCRLLLDGTGKAQVNTGIAFLDHLLDSLTRFSHFDLELTCRGDLAVDDHHTVEDCALVLGEALDQALGQRRGIFRFGWALAPMDEVLVRAAIDLSRRPYAVVNLDLRREKLGELACENIVHFLKSFATAGRLNLHVDVLRGENDHHRAEAAFKALALALRQAVAADGEGTPSTKGVL